MAVVLESGNTDVGLRAGEFIMKNREMALRQAMAQQEAARDAARIQLQREQMVQQQRMQQDEAFRQQANAASDLQYKYAALRQSAEENKANREMTAAQKRESDALARELANLNERGATTRQKQSMTHAEALAAAAEKKASEREKNQITRESEKEARMLQKDWDDKQQAIALDFARRGVQYNVVPYEQRYTAMVDQSLQDAIALDEAKKKADKDAESNREFAFRQKIKELGDNPTPMQLLNLEVDMAKEANRLTGERTFSDEYIQAKLAPFRKGSTKAAVDPLAASMLSPQDRTRKALDSSYLTSGEEVKAKEFETAMKLAKKTNYPVESFMSPFVNPLLKLADAVDPWGQAGSRRDFTLLEPAVVQAMIDAGVPREEIDAKRNAYLLSRLPAEKDLLNPSIRIQPVDPSLLR